MGTDVYEIIENCEIQLRELLGKKVKVWYSPDSSVYNMGNVFDATITVCDISRESALGKRRARNVVTARHLFSWLSRKYTGATLLEIGSYINRDYTTVIHSIQKVNELISVKDEIILNTISAIELKLSSL